MLLFLLLSIQINIAYYDVVLTGEFEDLMEEIKQFFINIIRSCVPVLVSQFEFEEKHMDAIKFMHYIMLFLYLDQLIGKKMLRVK
jgi:hypothetical protein